MRAGKSIVIAHTARATAGPVVIAVPSIRLVNQLQEDLPEAGAWYTHRKEVARITITTYSSLANLKPPCALLICDEAHQTENPEAIEAVRQLNPDRILGFTATPWRSDARQSLSLFEYLLYDYTPADALRDGVVVPFEVIPHTGMEADLDDVAVAMTQDAVDRGATLVNAWNIDDAEAFAARLRGEGVRCEAVHSRRKDNDDILARLASGELQAAVHVDMLREGVTMP
jgi:superfamily II DNA or RNA helicase